MTPSPTLYDRALWRAIALSPSAQERELLSGLSDLMERGARPDAVFPDILAGHSVPCHALDRLLCHVPLDAVPGRLQTLFAGGLDPLAAPLGWETCIAFCQATPEVKGAPPSPWSDLVQRLARLSAGTHEVGLMPTLVAAAMLAPQSVAGGGLDAVDVALRAGVSPMALPGMLSPLAVLLEHRGGRWAPVSAHADTPQVFLEIGRLLLRGGSSFNEPCAHLSALAQTGLGGREPATLRQWATWVLESGERFECEETLRILLAEG